MTITRIANRPRFVIAAKFMAIGRRFRRSPTLGSLLLVAHARGEPGVVYGFIPITVALSFTESRLLPNWEAGLERYADLFDNERLDQRENLAIFGVCLIGISPT